MKTVFPDTCKRTNEYKFAIKVPNSPYFFKTTKYLHLAFLPCFRSFSGWFPRAGEHPRAPTLETRYLFFFSYTERGAPLPSRPPPPHRFFPDPPRHRTRCAAGADHFSPGGIFQQVKQPDAGWAGRGGLFDYTWGAGQFPVKKRASVY